MDKHAYAFIGYTGQEISRFEIPWSGEVPEIEMVRMEGPAVETDRIRYLRSIRGTASGDITSVSVRDGILTVEIVPATTRADFILTVPTVPICGNKITPY